MSNLLAGEDLPGSGATSSGFLLSGVSRASATGSSNDGAMQEYLRSVYEVTKCRFGCAFESKASQCKITALVRYGRYGVPAAATGKIDSANTMVAIWCERHY